MLMCDVEISHAQSRVELPVRPYTVAYTVGKLRLAVCIIDVIQPKRMHMHPSLFRRFEPAQKCTFVKLCCVCVCLVFCVAHCGMLVLIWVAPSLTQGEVFF